MTILKNKKIVLSLFFIFTYLNIIFPIQIANILPVGKKQSSGIYVKKGDKIKLTVSGKWRLWDKYDLVGGEGHNYNINEYGNWGTLLGEIGDGSIFIVGTGTEITADNEGILYLFPNKDKYKIENASGNLEVTIDGGISVDKFKSQLSGSAKKIVIDPKDAFLPTDIYIEKGNTLEFYSFGEWSMWDGIYPESSADGHDFLVDGIKWGKLFGGIGTSYGEYIESFAIGEKTKYTSTESGFLTLFPFIDNYQSTPNGSLEIYVIGGKIAGNNIKINTDESIRKNIEDLLLNKINEFRNQCSLPLLEVKQNLSKTASNHAKYMVENNTFEREEKEDQPYFTGKTLEDRTKSMGFTGEVREMFCETDNIHNSINLFINTVYHRIRLMDPNLIYFGYGVYKTNEKSINVFDLGYLNEEEKVDWEKIIYPPNEASDVNIEWDGNESPDPLPIGTNKPLGYPISILFKKEIKKILLSEILDENGKSVNSFLVTPYTDLNNKNINAIIIIPKKKLNYNTKYTVNIKVKLGDDNEEKSYSWNFITKKEI